MVRLNDEDAVPRAAHESVVNALERWQAVRLVELTAQTGLGPVLVYGVLQRLADEGRVEILAPLRDPAGGAETRDMSRMDRVFFRLVRPHDLQFRGQGEIAVRLPVGRLRDVHEQEDGGARTRGAVAGWQPGVAVARRGNV